MITTAGQILVDDALPQQHRGKGLTLDKKETGRLMTQLAKELPPAEYVEVLQRLNNVGRQVATEYGRSASISLDDLKLPEEIKVKREKLREDLRKIRDSDLLTPEQKQQATVKTVEKFSKNIDDELVAAVEKQGGAFAEQIRSGSRGKPFQLRQMILGNLLSLDSRGKVVPYPGLEGYNEGLSPMAYWAATHGGRKGYVDLQFATADAGYFGKQITGVAHRMVVTQEDCGANDVGITVEGGDKDNVGAILAEDVGPLKRGTVITDEHLPLLKNREIMVRSPITCRAKEGVCASCTGVREKGTLPEIGEFVGINAVRSFVEPLTQAQISSKHVGGEKESASKRLSGFKQVDQFMQVPEEYVGGAVLAKMDGTVSDVKQAPQGGWNVIVNQEAHHVPLGYELAVKRGDKLEAGDAITDGVINPEELVQYKGLGEGRQYFLTHLRKLLDDNNSATNRRNLELLSRSFITRVQVTDPEGYNGHLIDDVIDYNVLAHDWQPRKNAKLKSVTTANKLYLEKPYLHYSIGTKVTPSVVKKLKNKGITQVLVNPDPPPFEPVVIRARDYAQYDKDWLTRMSGENLKRTLLQTVARGGTSEKDSVSYYPKLVNIGKTKI